MARARGSKARAGRLIAAVTSVTIATAALVAAVGVAPASAAGNFHLEFTTQPVGGSADALLGTQPVVTIKNASNGVVSSTAPISLHITPATGSPGAALAGCATVNAVAGVASFGGCAVRMAGTAYRLTATDATDQIAATSATFTITPGVATKLAFTTQPSSGDVNVALPTQPVVKVEDAFGNPTGVGTQSVGLASSGGGLTCASIPLVAVAGVAAFTGCKISNVGTGNTMTATASGLDPAVSSPPFSISDGTATKLKFVTQPGTGAPGHALTVQPAVAFVDASDRVVTTQAGTVALAMDNNPTGGTLSCNASPVGAVNGVATFAGCAVSLEGTGYTLAATGSPALGSPIESAAFTVTPFHLEFTTQPGNGIAGSTLSPQPVVTVRDKANNPVTTASATIALSIAAFTPATGGPGQLTCNVNPVLPISGVATFGGCTIDTVGTLYRLTATDAVDGLSVTSNAFTVAGPGAAPQRIFGLDAIDTSIAISQREYPTSGSAGAVVLARSDFFSDALAGGPLAAVKNAPLLITPGAPVSSSLDPRVQAEIQRVLPPAGHTVYVLGGPQAMAPGIVATLTSLGYTVERVAGANLFSTAVAIAGQLGNPTTIFEATGLNFPDALSAVPAAIHTGGAILLTNGSTQAPETAAYLFAHPPAARYAIGGPLAAAGADPTATAVYGPDLFGTSAAVANAFFPEPGIYGIATGLNFPDALSGGVFMATGGRLGPVLLVNTNTPIPPSISDYLDALTPGTPGVIFGGPIAVGDDVAAAVGALVG